MYFSKVFFDAQHFAFIRFALIVPAFELGVRDLLMRLTSSGQDRISFARCNQLPDDNAASADDRHDGQRTQAHQSEFYLWRHLIT